MRNSEVAKLLSRIADLLEIQGADFKPAAYRRAAQEIEALQGEIVAIWKQGKLEEIPGIGEGIAKKIAEFLKTGKLQYYEKLKQQIPMDAEALLAVEGLGPKKVKFLYDNLGIKNLKDLENAARAGKIATLPGMKEKTQQEILRHLEGGVMKKQRVILSAALPIAEKLRKALQGRKEVIKVDIAGSLRRRKETIGDIDILCQSTDPKATMEFFTALPEVKEILAKGPSKSSVVLKQGIQADLRIMDEGGYGAALLYFTGPKPYNIEMRKVAIKKGWKLSEYGLFKGKKRIAGKSESEVCEKLGMKYLTPEQRERWAVMDNLDAE